ncbi:hypothetical protein Noda2021_04370 [Candidatus Dependentiae bacterium Noda2021]|nr:hypothetical protein Noda2021_04370 [Candidatus Dependentiae bacterium Noda2021]
MKRTNVLLLLVTALPNAALFSMDAGEGYRPELTQGFTKGYDYVESVVRARLAAPVQNTPVINQTAEQVISIQPVVEVVSQTAAVEVVQPTVPTSWENIGSGFKALGNAGLHYIKETGRLVADLPWPNITNVFKNSCLDVQTFVQDVTKNRTMMVVTLGLLGYAGYKLYNKYTTYKNGGTVTNKTVVRNSTNATQVQTQEVLRYANA